MTMPHYRVDPLNPRDEVWFGLGVTAGDNDLGLGVAADGLADGLARLHGGLVSHRAGVDDADRDLTVAIVAAFSTGFDPAAGFQEPGQGVALTLIDLAAQGGDAKYRRRFIRF